MEEREREGHCCDSRLDNRMKKQQVSKVTWCVCYCPANRYWQSASLLSRIQKSQENSFLLWWAHHLTELANTATAYCTTQATKVLLRLLHPSVKLTIIGQVENVRLTLLSFIFWNVSSAKCKWGFGICVRCLHCPRRRHLELHKLQHQHQRQLHIAVIGH